MVSAPFVWVAESSVLRSGVDAFEKAVLNNGGMVYWIDVNQEMRQDYGVWAPDQKVIFRGSFEAAKRCSEKTSGPVILGSLDDFECTRYYPLIGNELLNRDYVMWPLGDLSRFWKRLPFILGSHDEYFLRPNSESKAFSGQLVPRFHYSHFERREACYLSQMASHDLCLVAAPQQIYAEYRLLVVSGQVMAESQYRLDDRLDFQTNVPQTVRNFGQRIANSLTDYRHYALDVAILANGALSVVELNSLSCASWYAADLEPVVAAVHAALKPVV